MRVLKFLCFKINLSAKKVHFIQFVGNDKKGKEPKTDLIRRKADKSIKSLEKTSGTKFINGHDLS